MKKQLIQTSPTVPLPERMPGEPERFYKRFLAFCLASGKARSIDAVFQAEQGAGGKGKKRQAPGSFYRAAEAWRWRDRASEWDSDVATAEAAELEIFRKEERVRRRALVSEFVTAAEKLLANVDAFIAAPASISSAVLRAISASRCEFPEPATESRNTSHALLSPSDSPPIVELYLDGGDGCPLPLSQMPEPDQLDPDFDPMADE